MPGKDSRDLSGILQVIKMLIKLAEHINLN